MKVKWFTILCLFFNSLISMEVSDVNKDTVILSLPNELLVLCFNKIVNFYITRCDNLYEFYLIMKTLSPEIKNIRLACKKFNLFVDDFYLKNIVIKIYQRLINQVKLEYKEQDEDYLKCKLYKLFDDLVFENNKSEDSLKELLKLLIIFDKDKNYSNKALKCSVIHGYNELAEIFIKYYGADANLLDEDNHSLLMYACTKGHKRIVEVLLKYQANPNFKGKIFGNTALKYAIKVGSEEIVKLLLENNTDVNNYTSYEETPLILAYKYGKIEIVKLLLKYKADFNVKEYNSGDTILILAVKDNNEDLVELLLDYGVDTKIKNKDNKTAKEVAISKGYLGIVRILESKN